MTELDQVRGKRDEALVKILARRVEPTFGFVIYGFVYLLLSSFIGVLGGLLGGGLCWLLHLTNDTVVASIIVYVFSLGAWAAAWIPFVRWVRRKRSNARSLVREGVLCEAKVATTTGDKATELAVKIAMGFAGSSPGVHWERVGFDHRGIHYTGVAPFESRAAANTPCHVLFHPLAKFALAFSPSGRAFVTKVHPRE